MRSLLSLCAAVLLLSLFAAGAATRVAEARGYGGLERRVVGLINSVRAQHGRPPLVASDRLTAAARSHSSELVRRGLLDHTSGDGTPMANRVRRFFPASAVGETLALVRRTQGAAQRVVRLWLASPPHRQVLLSAGFRRLGVGGDFGMPGGAATLIVTADFARR